MDANETEDPMSHPVLRLAAEVVSEHEDDAEATCARRVVSAFEAGCVEEAVLWTHVELVVRLLREVQVTKGQSVH